MTFTHRLLARTAALASALCWSVCATAVTPSDYAMPYVTNASSDTDTFKGITLVNSANFAQSGQLIAATANVFEPHIVNGADVDGTGLHDTRPHTLVWAQGNRWMRAALRSGLSPTPARFSNEAAANSTCLASVIYRDFAAPLTSALFYEQPGTNATCGDDDDVIKWVSINDASGTAPTTMTGFTTLHLSPIYKTDGKLAAIYTLQGPNVLRIASNLSTITTVRAGVSQFEVIGSLPDTTVIALIDGAIERIKPAGTLYPKPLRRPKLGYHIDQALLHGTEVFFTEKANDEAEVYQTRVTRIDVSGTVDAVLMLTLKQVAFLSGFTTGRLIYTVGDAGQEDMTLFSFPKAGVKGTDTATKIYKTTLPNVIGVFTTSGDNVFFNVSGLAFVFPDLINTQLALVKSDLGAAVKNYGDHSQFLGGQITDSGAGALEEQETFARLLLGTAGGADYPGVVGGKLFSLNPSTLKGTLLTDLADYHWPLLAIGFGAGSIGGLIDIDNNVGDVFAFDLVGGRYGLLTDGTANNEFPIY